LQGGRLIAFDKDPDARHNVPPDERFTLISEDFKFIESELEKAGVEKVDGILADLGISSHQIDTPQRGFSFRFDAPLDMRMNPGQGPTAAELLNEWDEQELARVFAQYGEVPNSRKLARTIVQARAGQRLSGSAQLESVIQDCIPKNRRSKYLAQVYQALRIVVNAELEALEQLLLASLRLLRPGGRMVVIAYHSLEDRMVKRFFRAGNLSGKVEKDFYGHDLTPWRLITRRAIQASQEEIARNPRARSARLRAAERR